MWYVISYVAFRYSEVYVDMVCIVYVRKGIVYKHWPDTREFITWTVEFEIGRLSCYYTV